MKTRTLIAALLIAGVVHAADDLQPLPTKWSPLAAPGYDSTPCKTGVDAQLEKQGQANLSITCSATGFLTIRQTFPAGELGGRRVRFSGWVKVEGIEPGDAGGRAGAGLLVNFRPQPGRPATVFTENNRLRGTTDWEYREIVVDVAAGPLFDVGIWLRGKGQVWARDFKFELIDTGNFVTSPPAITAGAGITLVPPAGLPPAPLAPLLAGWELMGNGGPLQLPGRCEVGVDSAMAGSSQPIHSVRCANIDLPSFGGAQYSFDSSRYRGKRLRVSGYLMTAGVEGVASRYTSSPGEAGLWLAVGSGNGSQVDRMPDRTVKGTTAWVYRDFVADVPSGNNKMMVGFWMQGKGQLWVRDLKVEEVPATTPLNFFFSNDSRNPPGPDLSLD